jgi:hypothetical protein
MNSDQGGQFTGFEWTQTLKDADVKISMDGKGAGPLSLIAVQSTAGQRTTG